MTVFDLITKLQAMPQDATVLRESGHSYRAVGGVMLATWRCLPDVNTDWYVGQHSSGKGTLVQGVTFSFGDR